MGKIRYYSPCLHLLIAGCASNEEQSTEDNETNQREDNIKIVLADTQGSTK